MKRPVIVFISVIIAALLLLTACNHASGNKPAAPTEPAGQMPSDTAAPTDSSPSASSAPDNSENGLLAAVNAEFALSGSILYFIDGSEKNVERLCFLDTETGESLPLCAKPECTHKDASCGAYMGHTKHLAAYGGRLYWTERPLGERSWKLISMNVDGTDRRVEAELGYDAYLENGDSGTMCVCGGKAYFCLCSEQLHNGNPVNRSIVFSYDLGTGDREQLFLEESGRFMIGRFYGEQLYMTFWYWEMIAFCRMDLGAGKTELLLETEIPSHAASPRQLYYNEGKLYVDCAGDFWCCDIDNRSFSILYKWNGDPESMEAPAFCTDEFAMLYNGMNEYVFRDADGKTLSEGRIAAEGFGLGAFEKETIGRIGDKLYFRFSPLDVGLSAGREDYLLSFDLNTYEWKTERRPL